MPLPRDEVALRDMLDSAEKALRLAKDHHRSDLDEEDLPLPYALIYLVAVIGEAAKKVSSDRRAQLSAISWKEITGMRDKLVHDYGTVDLDLLWITVRDRLPGLVAELRRVLES